MKTPRHVCLLRGPALPPLRPRPLQRSLQQHRLHGLPRRYAHALIAFFVSLSTACQLEFPRATHLVALCFSSRCFACTQVPSVPRQASRCASSAPAPSLWGKSPAPELRAALPEPSSMEPCVVPAPPVSLDLFISRFAPLPCDWPDEHCAASSLVVPRGCPSFVLRSTHSVAVHFRPVHFAGEPDAVRAVPHRHRTVRWRQVLVRGLLAWLLLGQPGHQSLLAVRYALTCLFAARLRSACNCGCFSVAHLSALCA